MWCLDIHPEEVSVILKSLLAITTDGVYSEVLNIIQVYVIMGFYYKYESYKCKLITNPLYKPMRQSSKYLGKTIINQIKLTKNLTD
jgi:hypothetical protein